jgi:hypothetical protein
MNASGGMHRKFGRREPVVFKRSSIPPRTAGRWPRAQRWPEPLVVLFVDVVIIIRRFLPRYEETRLARPAVF